MRRRAALLALLAPLVAPATAAAQSSQPLRPLGGEAPTAGIRLHTPTPVGTGDASAIEINPAALAQLEAGSLVLQHTELRSTSRLQGEGDALFAASPVPYLPSLVLGGGLQWLRPATAIGYADSVKLSLGASWTPDPALALGAVWTHFWSNDDPALDRLSSVDVGLLVRPAPWLALGLAVRDLTTPVLAGLPLQRSYDLELAWRPLGNRRLELGAGVVAGERRGDLDPSLRVVAEPWPGLQLFAQAQLVTRDFYRNGDRVSDLRGNVGLQLALERARAAISTVVGRSLAAGAGPLGEHPGTRSAYQGVSVSLALDGARRAPLVQPSPRLVQLELSGKLTQRRLIRLVQALRALERRADVRGLLLRIGALDAGWAQAQELRAWIHRLRRAGKRVLAYLEAPATQHYYVAAAADRLLIDDAGGVRLQGLGETHFYLRGLFDHIGVQPQFVRIAEYKTAPEGLTRRGPSAPARAMTTARLDDVFEQLVQDLARDRRLPPARVRALIDHGPFTALQAQRAGLIDEVLAPAELRRRVQRNTRAELVPLAVVARGRDRWPGGPAIAVVVIDGDIIDGHSRTVPLLGRELVGDETVVAALEAARLDAKIRAVVLRIDSPGGSALASHHLWAAVRALRRVKPVVVSLANIAASGGYYAACAGDRIFAQPAAITGSIGIFTGKVNVGGLLRRLGIGHATSLRGARAGLDSPVTPYSAEEERFILQQLQHFYRQFLGAVAAGRGLTQDAVHAVARGRIWTGAQAQRQHLVDAVGGLQEALVEAQRRAGLADDAAFELVVLPKRDAGLLARAGRLLTPDQPSDASTLLPQVLSAALADLPLPLWYARSGQALARLPYELVSTP
ncbi:MAG: signal peptide peptidase SppA [Proteobacteria bacterium]|nr:signal peptide peptidase SppA [Pseudomonadota bacterium]